MTLKKLLASVFITACVSTMFAFTAFAATSGWAIENGQTVYYDNGVKVVNKWAANGDKYYYLNSMGYTSPDWTISATGGQLAGITPVASSVAAPSVAVTSPQAAAVNAYNAALAQAQANAQAQALANAQAQALLIAAAKQAAPVNESMLTDQQKAAIEDNYFRRHSYTDHYEQYDSENHKACCACGEWMLAPHNFVEEKNKDGKTRHVCSLCRAD